MTEFLKKLVKPAKTVGGRTLKTMIQVAVAFLTAETATSGIADVDWALLGSVTALAGLVAFLTNLGNELPDSSESV